MNILSFDPEIADQLEQGTTLVTATKRLAREIRLQFNNHQASQKKQAWASPDILTFEAWSHRLWQAIIQRRFSDSIFDYQNTPPLVLNDAQCRSVWRQIIRKDISSTQAQYEPLWNIPATVSSAINAWKISCEWHIDIQECQKSSMSDHRSYARWAKQYKQQCIDNQWTDNYQLIDIIVQNIQSEAEFSSPNLVFFGFDVFTEQQSQLISTIETYHADLTLHNLDQSASGHETKKNSSEFEDEYAQWLGAAYWAKRQIEANPDKRIALVVPNLYKSRDIIDYALAQTLCPGKILGVNDSTVKPFHISLGKKLAEFPLVEAALLLLSLVSAKPIANTTISKVLLNPFLGGASTECHDRSKLEYWCRRNLPYQITLSGFMETLIHSRSAPTSTLFSEILSSAVKHESSMQSQQTYATWSDQILFWLNIFGWPGETGLNSEEFQTAEAFKREVSNLASLDLVSEHVSCASAITTLTQQLAEQPFEPESLSVNIEVLGVPESAGVHFDAIWFGDMNENTWPPALQENPFLPYWLQKQSRNPHTSTELNYELAQTQQTRLINQCTEIIFSRPCFDNDVLLNPSPLNDQTDLGRYEGNALISHFQDTEPKFEIFEDTHGLTNVKQSSQGGVSVIQDQAACPFRAYAKHRLGTYATEPRQPGLDAAERGSLIHKILEHSWRKINSSKNLHALSKQGLAKIIAKNVDRQSKYFFDSSGCSNQFFTAQNEWLVEILLQWFDLEITRDQEFVIVDLEKKQSLLLDSLTLNFKIDRIDRLKDNSLLLVDYKTGRTGAITGWVDERPESPQLPLYALAEFNDQITNPDSPISALAFAQVRNGECTYAGISRDDSFQSKQQTSIKIQPIEKIKIDDHLKDWQALFEYWQDNLTRIATEFQSGYAAVDPLPNACIHCDLHELCRISEWEP